LSYNIKYTPSFIHTSRLIANDWAEIGMSEATVAKQMKAIRIATELLEVFPEMYEDVSEKYGFDIPTRRIPIGDRYAIFYRIDDDNKLVIIGSMFNLLQMNVKF
jgi:plasmid stabilization system protein ParE